ncbi:autophagy protein 16, interacts with Atg12p-Atg5p [Extremus antarcticus]|uniref:Autophagy protein 16, interacts with Atg12p-Atg5p n=1 Tax=Extremus antarcticus TaxID=702011 RepID=A0AAJ0D9A3_9PEZI|nr:autophagy protein 16, interacts with Atg12p-Atg5p [Extremus antarcticus]
MTDWIDQYSAALDIRDVREQAHKPYIDAFTKLADRTTSLAAPPPPSPAPALPLTITKTPSRGKTSSPAPDSSPDALTRLRTDLSTTQKARSALQTQVTDLSTTLSTIELQQKSSTSQIAVLSQQKTALERRLKDREDELRGKQKLVEDAQDEMVAQGLQMNVAEEKAKRLEVENKELVERWMRRMGEEADKVNRESSWR